VCPSNLIAHEYFRIDLEVINAIIAERLNELAETAERRFQRSPT
jgi:uncharacterized protein with HEPN domain